MTEQGQKTWGESLGFKPSFNPIKNLVFVGIVQGIKDGIHTGFFLILLKEKLRHSDIAGAEQILIENKIRARGERISTFHICKSLIIDAGKDPTSDWVANGRKFIKKCFPWALASVLAHLSIPVSLYIATILLLWNLIPVPFTFNVEVLSATLLLSVIFALPFSPLFYIFGEDVWKVGYAWYKIT